MTSQSIRDAVHDGDYVRAAELFDEWACHLTIDEETLREIADLARWVRAAVLCAHAHTEGRIQILRDESRAASAYAH